MTHPLVESNNTQTFQNTTFADRLKFLVQGESVSSFARRVGLNESLIRKYLRGSEPSLSRADQIARAANVSLQWLANGSGTPTRHVAKVDNEALELADRLVSRALSIHVFQLTPLQRTSLVISLYQFLSANRKADGSIDSQSGQIFVSDQLLQRKVSSPGTSNDVN